MKKKVLALLCAMVMILAMMPVASAATAPTVTIDGASIRTTSPQGLRFKITVTNVSEATDYGIVLSYGGSVKTISCANGYTNIYSTDGDTIEYTAVLINIPSTAFETDITAYGFVTYEDGSTQTVTTTSITRNIQGVANTAGQEIAEDGTISDMGGTEVTVYSWGSSSFYDCSSLQGEMVNISLKVRLSGMEYGASASVGLQDTPTYNWLADVTLSNAWTTVSVSNYTIPATATGLYFGGTSDIYSAGGCLYVTDVSVKKVDTSGNYTVDLTSGVNGYSTSFYNDAAGNLVLSFTDAYGQMGFALGSLDLSEYSSVKVVYTKSGSDAQFQVKITDGAGANSTATDTDYPGYGIAAGVEKTETVDISSWSRSGATYLLIGSSGDADLVMTISSITLCK